MAENVELFLNNSNKLTWQQGTCIHDDSYPPPGRAIAQAVSRLLPTAAARFEPRSGHVGLVMYKVALGEVFYEYFCFPCQFSFHRLLHIHHLSSVAGIIDQNSGRRTKWIQSHPTSRTTLWFNHCYCKNLHKTYDRIFHHGIRSRNQFLFCARSR
jgi:hypothetical protein